MYTITRQTNDQNDAVQFIWKKLNVVAQNLSQVDFFGASTLNSTTFVVVGDDADKGVVYSSIGAAEILQAKDLSAATVKIRRPTSVYMPSTFTSVVATSGGDILRSQDCATTWIQLQVPEAAKATQWMAIDGRSASQESQAAPRIHQCGRMMMVMVVTMTTMVLAKSSVM